MSLNSMAQRLILEVPGIASAYARTLLNEALTLIEDSQLWSFQLATSGFLTPGLLFPVGPGNSAGFIIAKPFTNTIIGDAVASAAWQAYTGMPLFTQLQIRSPYYSLYNIIKMDTSSNPPFTTLTLDRPWMEPGGAAQPYMIYQAYFPVPVSDFKRFITVVDMTDNSPMDYWSYTQKDLAYLDPQRTNFDQPDYFVPYQVDQRPNSASLGNLLIELWPQPLDILPYSFNYLRRGPQLVNPNDTVPYPFTEELVLWRAKVAACLWKAQQKGENMDRGSGADWKFLAQAAHDEYKTVLKTVRERDRDMCELAFTRLQLDYPNGGMPFATLTGSINVGRF